MKIHFVFFIYWLFFFGDWRGFFWLGNFASLKRHPEINSSELGETQKQLELVAIYIYQIYICIYQILLFLKQESGQQWYTDNAQKNYKSFWPL